MKFTIDTVIFPFSRLLLQHTFVSLNQIKTTNMETLVKTKWAIDPAHTEIQFKVKHLVISTVSGKFEKFDGAVHTSSSDFSDAEVEFSADVNSINTGQPDRDAHLKSADFFDAANYPKIVFKSKNFKKTGDDTYIMTGDLTIRGTTKTVELNVEYGGTTKDPWGNTKAGFEITGKINRKDFGLAWSAVTETGGLVVADEVKLQLAVELAKS
jgi:polyisoprenoid-binding protein YceI